MKTLAVDVFVVGAGPTGLTCAALLARDGVNVAAITRYPGLANSPRAHVINQRTMEVFRDLGIEDRVTASAMPATFISQVIWAESFTGPEIARRRGWGAGADRCADYAAASPCVPTNIPQHVLEPILCEAAGELGARVIFNLELVSMHQEDDHVLSVCRDRVTEEEVHVTSRYVVGADGDNSTVCREIGFEVEGMMGLGHMLNYWVETDLAAYTEHRPGALYQIFRPGGRTEVDSAVFVTVRPSDEWIVSVPYDPTQGEPDISPEAAARVVRTYVGDPDLEVRLISTSRWTINQVYADVMHRGRVVIAGNAAHRHPPAGGLGANTCVQDAFNLAWKLRLLLDGSAQEPLLASYTDERAPVAREIVHRANRTLGALMEIPQALGLTPGQSTADGLASMRHRFDDSAAGDAQRRRLNDAVRNQDDNFNALGIELGQRYESTAIISDGSAVELTRDPGLHYEPNTVPGSSLPHAWLTKGGKQLSSLDIVGRGRFTVLTGIGGHAWHVAACALADELGLPLDAVQIGPGLDVEDPYGEWAALRGVAEDGCVLVRPDRHVAFRSDKRVDAPLDVLRDTVSAILGQPETPSTAPSPVAAPAAT